MIASFPGDHDSNCRGRLDKGSFSMDDGFSFFCGSVPILLLLWRHGGGPGPGPLILLLAGCIGGLVSYMVFGPTLAKGGGAFDILTIAVAGGAFAGIAVDAALGMAGRRGQTGTGV
jgi:hypothetical protein